MQTVTYRGGDKELASTHCFPSPRSCFKKQTYTIAQLKSVFNDN